MCGRTLGRKKRDDSDFEVRFYEGILQNKPDFIEALLAIGDLYTRKGMYEQGLKVDQQLAQLRPEDPYIHYNLACSYSLLGQVDEALVTIQTAVERGYDDLTHLEKDRDLRHLRKDARFKAYLAKLKGSRDIAKKQTV